MAYLSTLVSAMASEEEEECGAYRRRADISLRTSRLTRWTLFSCDIVNLTRVGPPQVRSWHSPIYFIKAFL